MQKHIQLLGIVYILYHAIGLVMAWFVWAFLAGIGIMSGDAQAAGVLAFIGTLVAGVLLVTSLPGVVAGIGILKGWWWARYLGMLLAFFNLFAVPVGTLLGIYTFWVLMQDETIAYFDSERGLAPGAPPAA